MIRSLNSKIKARIEARMLDKYKTPDQRFSFISKRLSTFGFDFSVAVPRDSDRGMLYLSALEDDEIFLGLSKYRGFKAYLIFKHLREAPQSSFNYLLKLYCELGSYNGVKVSKINRQLGVDHSKLHGVLLGNHNSKGYSESYYRLASIYNNYASKRGYIFKPDLEKESSVFMLCFVKAWSTLFSDAVKNKVVEVLEAEPSYFSIENIYTLSMMGYEAELEGDRTLGVLGSTKEWLYSILSEPEDKYEEYIYKF